MAFTIYMSVTGAHQGPILGSCAQAGEKRNKILVYALSHQIEIPTDTHQAVATGQRIHAPLTVSKGRDVASPKLLQACCSGERCSVTLDFYQISADGEEYLYYQVTLNNAIIVSRKGLTPTTFLRKHQPYPDLEEVSFSYSEIIETHTQGNIETIDSWLDGDLSGLQSKVDSLDAPMLAL
ncbi:type VI secretion system tube protein TssD [Dongshaea marina]|uniref:type VI secretion system tube protein TssD n=1 Tax=Dongshaea marina TaxID=2047966 RepID=UPI000D3E1787|nr:type VI secretion system tube protein TssD [Dongshaea marina]